MKTITIKGKKYKLPIYLPDATRAVVKATSFLDVKNVGTEGVVVNTYHLESEPGVEILKKFGGVRGFMNFDGLVVSDSGGWQIFSLIHRNKNKGKITDEGVTFSIGGGKEKLFSPEKSIRVQFELGADIIVCLDDFTPPNSRKEDIEKSVERTILWAKRCRAEYDRIVKEEKLTDKNRPMLLGVIQGGEDKELRAYCAKELLKIGMDGLGFGGYPIDENGKLDWAMAEFVAGLIPDDKIKFALGVGKIEDIVACHEFGWDIFDCTLPTRDARHKRLYVLKKENPSLDELRSGEAYDYIYIGRGKHGADEAPVSDFCDCPVCQNFSRAYLNHLFAIGDVSAMGLSTIHNLRVYNKVIEILRNSKH